MVAAKTERFELRLDEDILERIDSWRSRQSDLPSRAEAVRRLVERGFGAEGVQRVSFTDGEKMIIVMLNDLYKHLKVKGEVRAEFVVDTIYGGHPWALEWDMSGLFHGYE